MLTKEELAMKLNGREYRREFVENEHDLARDSGLVIVFGASDDLCMFSGAYSEEYDAWEGDEFCFTKNLVFTDKHDYIKSGENVLKAKWCEEKTEKGQIIPWTYETNFPCSRFIIMEDDEIYCIGIVFDVKDLK